MEPENKKLFDTFHNAILKLCRFPNLHPITDIKECHSEKKINKHNWWEEFKCPIHGARAENMLQSGPYKKIYWSCGCHFTKENDDYETRLR